jgi:hypothetical protein
MSAVKAKLYTLARRLNVGRVLRYGDLWARYYWRRAESAATSFGRGAPGTGADALAAELAKSGMDEAKRLAVASWFPLDLANARLHRAVFEAVVQARPDLGITPAILDCLASLKSASDLTECVDRLVVDGASPETLNTALYLLLLRRLPAPSERAMIASRSPHHALIAIQSGDEYRRHGRRIGARVSAGGDAA